MSQQHAAAFLNRVEESPDLTDKFWSTLGMAPVVLARPEELDQYAPAQFDALAQMGQQQGFAFSGADIRTELHDRLATNAAFRDAGGLYDAELDLVAGGGGGASGPNMDKGD